MKIKVDEPFESGWRMVEIRVTEYDVRVDFLRLHPRCSTDTMELGTTTFDDTGYTYSTHDFGPIEQIRELVAAKVAEASENDPRYRRIVEDIRNLGVLDVLELLSPDVMNGVPGAILDE